MCSDRAASLHLTLSLNPTIDSTFVVMYGIDVYFWA
jgi:hypothetical protein